MKKLIYLIVLTLILGLVLTGCLLSNVGQVPTTGQSGASNLTKGISIPIILTLSSNESETKQAGWTTTDPILDPLNPNSYSGMGSWSDAFLVTPHSAWYPPFDPSKWVSTASSLESACGNGDSWRLFKAEFNIPTGAIIIPAQLWMTADNAVAAYFNDKSHEVGTTTNVYGASPSPQPWYFANLYGPFNFIPVEGTNTLYFVVRNWGIGSHNPVGLLYSAKIEYTMPLEVPVDIKPTSCPNPINTKSNGVTPVAILGTLDFDVTQIDPVTVTLAGASPLRWDWEDVATPFEPYTGKEDCDLDCNTLGPDGYLDLTLKFNTQEILDNIGTVESFEVNEEELNTLESGVDDQVTTITGEILAVRDCIVIQLEGLLLDGTPIIGEDVVRILEKGKK